MIPVPVHFTADEISREAERLFRVLIGVDCVPGRRWDYAECIRLAPLTLEINRLKKEKNAIILAHSYVEPEIVYGISDFRGDSYYLSRVARDARAQTIVFAGVVFMAETAKILSPDAIVIVPDRASGCSLADSLSGEELRRLKSLHPDAAVVCYVNSTAEVKAESDVCVTSGNAADIVAALPERQILFVPDRLMSDNLRLELRRRGIDKEIISSDGTCVVHDHFDANEIARVRVQFPGVKVVAHPECPTDVAAAADFVGNTESMMRYVRTTVAPYFLMLTECGLVARVQVEDPEKRLVGGCRLCPYMKLNSLEKVRDALAHPRPDQIITLDESVRRRAARSLERMFELTAGAASSPWQLVPAAS
ncbi:MAG TPA: quinolinate synthase NadA [Candidatus Didemnitutus sp.]|nr:quinolinate synthase NadA [Candidatus Didemnitutus sp.]